jgi:hypothetical protein
MPPQLPDTALCTSVLDLPRTHLSPLTTPHRSKFTQADADADGVLTRAEWLASLGAPADLAAHARWAKFDTEGKGFLTAQEAFERRAA